MNLKRCRIVDLSAPSLDPYGLVDEAGEIRHTGPNPHRLSDWAFDHGADEVRHDYDLRAWEERR